MARTATVVFDEYPDDEVVLRISPVSVDDFFDVIEAINGPLKRDEFTALAERFAPYVESWTFDLPTDAAGLRRLDVNLALALPREWLREVNKVPAPLALRPSDGEPSEEPPE